MEKLSNSIMYAGIDQQFFWGMKNLPPRDVANYLDAMEYMYDNEV